MTKRRIELALLLVLGLGANAAAAGPELAVGATCGANTVAPGATLTVPITFRAGTSDKGAANEVSAADFVVSFAADAFTVGAVQLPQGLAATGQWTVDWEGTIENGQVVPGRAGILLAPNFEFPVPRLPDGTIVELVLVAMGAARCVPIEIASDSVVLSAPPVGLEIAAGPIAGGGAMITGGPPPPPPAEQCQDCADNDGDGLTDLADPDCGARPATFAGKPEKVTVRRKKSGAVLVTMRGTLPKAFDEATETLRVVLLPAGTGAEGCFTLEAAGTGRGKKRKRTYLFKRGGKKMATLISDLKHGRSTLAATLTGVPVPPQAPSLSVSIWSGNDPFYADLQLKKCTKKVCTYK